MKILLYITLLVFLSGCGEQLITNTTITPGATVGDIVGKVQLYGIAKNIQADAGGVMVALENTSYFTTTDNNGMWKLKDIPSGNYTISFSKQGYSYKKDFTLSLYGNGTLYYHFNMPNAALGFTPTYLYQISEGTPTLSLSAFTGQWVSKDTIYTDSLGVHYQRYDFIPYYYATYRTSFGETEKDNLGKGVAVFFGKNNSVSPDDPFTYSFSACQSGAIRDSNGLYYLPIAVNRDLLYTWGFSPGEKVYCVAYVGSPYSVFQGYFDPIFNHDICSGTGKGHSEIKSFICP